MQNLVVALIVLAAACYAVWRLAPAALRQALAARTGTLARATGASEHLARRIEIKAAEAAANAGGCGSCGPCKACATGQGEGQGELPGRGEPPGQRDAPGRDEGSVRGETPRA